MTQHPRSNLSERAAACGKPCKHYDSRGSLLSGNACKIGHPIRKITMDAAGTEVGLHFLMPCSASPEAVVSCPDFRAFTPEEDAERDREFAASMQRSRAFIAKLPEWRRWMVANGKPQAKATCPCCGERGAVVVTCAIDCNQHVHARCTKCGVGVME